jgi:Domain of unknown function (DUF4388)
MLTDIAQSPIAETIRRLSTERRTGDLQVRAGRMVKIAFFDHGRLVFAASNLRRDRLGEAMVADGRITEEDFNRVSALMRTDRRRFGEALVQAGVMDRYDVGASWRCRCSSWSTARRSSRSARARSRSSTW